MILYQQETIVFFTHSCFVSGLFTVFHNKSTCKCCYVDTIVIIKIFSISPSILWDTLITIIGINKTKNWALVHEREPGKGPPRLGTPSPRPGTPGPWTPGLGTSQNHKAKVLYNDSRRSLMFSSFLIHQLLSNWSATQQAKLVLKNEWENTAP